MKTAIIFPGQGVQAIGMAKDFVDNFKEAEDVFMLANETLNRDIYKLVMAGDIDDLNITKNTQPAIITAEMAMLQVFLKHLYQVYLFCHANGVFVRQVQCQNQHFQELLQRLFFRSYTKFLFEVFKQHF